MKVVRASKPVAVLQSRKIAERLLAHGRLCRQMAQATAHEDTALMLTQMADDCDRAALDCDSGAEPAGKLH